MAALVNCRVCGISFPTDSDEADVCPGCRAAPLPPRKAEAAAASPAKRAPPVKNVPTAQTSGGIQIDTHARAARPTAGDSGARRGSSSRTPQVLIALGAVALVGLVGLAGLASLWAFSDGEPEVAKKEGAAPRTPDRESAPPAVPAFTGVGGASRLIIEWPANERTGGTLSVNGRNYKVPLAGPIELPLVPGSYDIRLTSGSGATAQHRVTLTASRAERIAPQWVEAIPAAGAGGNTPDRPIVERKPPREGIFHPRPRPAPEPEPKPEPKPEPEPKPTPEPEPTPVRPPQGPVPPADPQEADDENPFAVKPTDDENPFKPAPADKPPPAESGDEPKVTAVEQKLVGKTATLLFWKGDVIEDAEITAVTPGPEELSLQSLVVRSKGGLRTIRIMPLSRIVIGEQVYNIHNREQSSVYTLFDVNAHLKKVDVSLRREGHMLWPKLSEEERAEIIQKEKAFLEKVGERFPGMRLYETKYFLFYTDIPPQQADFFVSCLDQMYEKLCMIFGATGGQNIWWGKAVVVAFLEEASYHAFEQGFMGNPNSPGTAGLHHGFSNGRVVIAIHRGDNPHEFAHTLVHETAHGFLHRYKSNVHVVSWVNEGVAEWVGRAVVPQCKQVPLKEALALDQLRARGSLGGNFFDDNKNIDGWQYGVAYQITKLMIGAAPMRYGAFIDGVKEGKSVEQSLIDTYGWTAPQLVQVYARAVGMPLRP